MKKLILLLLFIPFVFFGQTYEVETTYDPLMNSSKSTIKKKNSPYGRKTYTPNIKAFMDVEGILSGYFNGEPYTGPFTLISDGSIKSGIGKNRGCDLNFTGKAARKAVKKYLVRCK
jgi:hypothetical protein